MTNGGSAIQKYQYEAVVIGYDGSEGLGAGIYNDINVTVIGQNLLWFKLEHRVSGLTYGIRIKAVNMSGLVSAATYQGYVQVK
jgi:hypothetical protein